MDIRMKTEIDWNWVERELVNREKIKGSSLDILKESLGAARRLAAPIVICANESVTGRGGSRAGVITIGGVKLTSRYLASYLKGASYAYIFLATIGGALEESATALMKEGSEPAGYLLDRAGSFAVESLAQGYEERLREEYMARESSVSMRMSPGYCDWPVEEQRKLDTLLDFSRAGVRLTEACMMVPRKSVSAVVGIGPKGLFSAKVSQCGICNMKDCDLRRA